jgi:hypothetical protein
MNQTRPFGISVCFLQLVHMHNPFVSLLYDSCNKCTFAIHLYRNLIPAKSACTIRLYLTLIPVRVHEQYYIVVFL